MNGGGAASGAGAAEGRGRLHTASAPPRGQKKRHQRRRRASGQDERAPGTPIRRSQLMSEVEQLLTRESPGLAGVGELARLMTSGQRGQAFISDPPFPVKQHREAKA